jgi:phosphoribosyl-ATP pyrophosphohydrolase/phosphoribosyl-AMP cyclohydrolase
VNIDYSKHPDGLVPAIVQDDATLRVLMLGYMNEESLARTMETGFVTFFSRSKGRLWTKGEESGHRLKLRSVALDCDRDTRGRIPAGTRRTVTPTSFNTSRRSSH